MSDIVAVRDLCVKTRIGVSDAERAASRVVWLRIEMETDVAPAGRSDELDDTVDYASVISRVANLASTGEFRLLEHLAERVAAEILAAYRITGVTVEVAKEPPVPEDVREVAVRVHRTRP